MNSGTLSFTLAGNIQWFNEAQYLTVVKVPRCQPIMIHVPVCSASRCFCSMWVERHGSPTTGAWLRLLQHSESMTPSSCATLTQTEHEFSLKVEQPEREGRGGSPWVVMLQSITIMLHLWLILRGEKLVWALLLFLSVVHEWRWRSPR